MLLLCGSLVFFCLPQRLEAQFRIPTPDEENLFARSGVNNASASKGIDVRYEAHAGFDWTTDTRDLGRDPRRVDYQEHFTFKFKVPVINSPSLKFLLGYEWDTEKYHFAREYSENAASSNIWAHLDEQRLKTNKFSAYLTKSFNERFYTSIRLRMSLNGDYEGLVNFNDPYRSYGVIAGIGVKPSENKEWGVGVTFSQNDARRVLLPFLIYNITWSERWGLETVLPGAAFLRHNFTQDNKVLVGAEFYSKFYALNWTDTPGGDRFAYFFRNNGVRFQADYEHKLTKWIWAYAQGGYFLPVTATFSPVDDSDMDLDTSQGGRPFLRVGLFLSPPEDYVK